MPHPTLWFRGGGTLACGRGVGESQFRGDILCGTLFLYLLCAHNPFPLRPPSLLPLPSLLCPTLIDWPYPCVLKPNSLTYNFIEVSWHNLESSQTLGFCMYFLNLRERVRFSIRFSSFLLYCEQKLNCKNCKRLRKFEEIEILRQSCR